MIMEMMALRARIADLQGEAHGLRDKIRKEVQEDYEALVQNIFMICLQLKVGTEVRLNWIQPMTWIILEITKAISFGFLSIDLYSKKVVFVIVAWFLVLVCKSMDIQSQDSRL